MSTHCSSSHWMPDTPPRSYLKGDCTRSISCIYGVIEVLDLTHACQPFSNSTYDCPVLVSTTSAGEVDGPIAFNIGIHLPVFPVLLDPVLPLLIEFSKRHTQPCFNRFGH